MRRSLVSGPYESAVSMKLTPLATTWRRRAMAAAGSGGSPQTPAPVMRIAPKPRRLTVRSPPKVMVPAAAGPELVAIPLSPATRSFPRASISLLSHPIRMLERTPAVELKTPYLLFLGDAPDQLAAKTAAGVAYWRPEKCVGQFR